MKTHSKHSKLAKRPFGRYAPNELAILGTNCNTISQFVQDVSHYFETSWKLAYLDASHQDDLTAPLIDTFTFHSVGHLDSNTHTVMNRYNDKIKCSSYDLTFINGNHFMGAQQILILDEAKRASVLKRLDQLNDIQCIVKTSADVKLFDFLLEQHPHLKNTPTFDIADIPNIAKYIEQLIRKKLAPLKGLVLAGGKSTRMGTDKGLLVYDHQDQRSRSLQLLKTLGLEAYLSVRSDQNIEIENKINDSFLGLGPFGAICSAFQKEPNTAWLVMATDLPFLDQVTLEQLVAARNPSKFATALQGTSKEFPEPLITIWEPKSYPILLQYLALGISCPRKVLINNDIDIVTVDEQVIRNINTPEEYQKAKKEFDH